MLFNSFLFIGFFLAVILIIFAESLFGKNIVIRNITLLSVSYFFYGYFNLFFLVILFFVSIVNYIGGNLLFNLRKKTECSEIYFSNIKKAKAIVAVVTVLSLIPLVFYKYALFICSVFASLLQYELDFELLNGILLPVGISFFTFQALSYVIDVYRGKIESRPSAIDFFLFVAFFPTILSGPIEKARNLLPQIKKYFLPSSTNIAQGTCIFIWGLFKKVVVADRLAQYVDYAYAIKGSASGLTLALAAVFYSIQIYCDFSGYSDMALGVAKALGFDITKNFRQPYFSRTFKEFWRRWHIALTSWFTEYVYFSLGGSRVKHKLRWVFNISTIFLLSGIWHGAAWNFVIWGSLHAIYYLAEHFIGLQKKNLNWNWFTSLLGVVVVFILATFAWIFFRVATFEDATFIIGRIITNLNGSLATGSSTFTFGALFVVLFIFILYEVLIKVSVLQFDTEENRSVLTRNIIAILPMLLMISLFGISSDNFVYFKF